MIASGSVAIMGVANWRAIGGTPSPTANAQGDGAYRSVFQYTINGVTGTQVGAVIPVPEPAAIASSILGLAIGCWQLLRRRMRSGSARRPLWADGPASGAMRLGPTRRIGPVPAGMPVPVKPSSSRSAPWITETGAGFKTE